MMYGAIKMDVIESDVDEMNPFKENLDPKFWKQVDDYYDQLQGRAGISLYKVEVRLRLKKIEDSFKNKLEKNDDFLIYLLTTLHDVVMKRLLDINKPELQDTFIKLLSQFAIILLEEDNEGYLQFPINFEEKANSHRKYEGLVDLPNDEKVEKASILHLAAKKNLCDIAQKVIQLYPKVVSKNDSPRNKSRENRKRLPVEYALDENNDEVCCIIMKKMTNERVRKLFMGRDESDIGRYPFGNLVKNRLMKQTVLCVLDACINPNFPYIKENENNKSEREEEGREIWSKIPSIPFQYNFKFRILDGDENGRPARVFENMSDNVGYINDKFLSKTSSPLQVIANYATTDQKEDEPQDPIKHILVRQLVREKWMKYGEFWIRFYFSMYLVFLLALSIALFLGAMSDDPTTYNSGKDKLRAICEIVTLLFTMFYLGSEIDQFCKERGMYCKDKWNFFDVVGLLLIVILIPCRFSDAITVSRSISVAAYFINFMRVFKFLPALNEDLAVYAKTFKEILFTDIVRFSSIFMIVMMAFAGSVYLALLASNSLDDNFRNFLDVFMQELRALTEGKEFADSYRPYHIVLTLFILLNMASIIVIMSNILIGQLGFRYGEAMNNAKLQYDIDKAKLITSLERSWFRKWNSRIKYYKDGIFVSNKEMIADLLIYWNKTMDNERETEDAIRSMIKKDILKREE